MDITLATILLIVKKQWKTFLLVFVVTFILSAVISFILPVYYQSSSSFFPLSPNSYDPRTKQSNIQLYGTVEDANRTIELAQSGMIRDYIIHKYNLVQRYGYDTSKANEAAQLIKDYEGNLQAKETNKGAIKISFSDKSADTAAYIVNDIVAQINAINKQVIIDALSRQIKAYDKVIKDKYMELDTLNKYIDGLKGTKEISPSREVVSMEMFSTFSAMKIMQANLTALYEDNNTIQIIEKAVPIRKKSSPKRMIIVAIACLATFIVTLIFLLLKDTTLNKEERHA